MKTHALVACPSCGRQESTPVVLGSGDGETLQRCTSCDLIRAERYADWEEIYTDGYLTGESAFGLDLDDPTFQSALDVINDKRLRWIERVAGRPRRLLDVGCGSGELLRIAERRGWDAVGVEPVPASASKAAGQGLTVHATTLEESGLPEASFDVATAFHVLEHMPEGTEFLETMRRCVAPGGWAVVEVPNFRSMHRRNTGPSWPGLRPLEHVAHYTPATLAGALERAGLPGARVRTMSFLSRTQPLIHMLGDLGQSRCYPLFEHLSSRRAPIEGQERIAWPPVRGALYGVQAVYDLAKVGQVVVGMARVPD